MKIDWEKVDRPEPAFERFASRRSGVFGTKGVVAASQPLAVEAGLEILRAGGNAGAHQPFPFHPKFLFLGMSTSFMGMPACRRRCHFQSLI